MHNRRHVSAHSLLQGAVASVPPLAIILVLAPTSWNIFNEPVRLPYRHSDVEAMSFPPARKSGMGTAQEAPIC